MTRREEREETYDDVERDAERLRRASEDADENARKAARGEEYEATIKQMIERNWHPPSTVPGDLYCPVVIRQIPDGAGVYVRITAACNAEGGSMAEMLRAIR